MFKALLFLSVLNCAHPVPAQNNDDPLQKPQIWQELVESPLDEMLWGKYFAKAFVCMSSKEREMFFSLKNQLMLRKTQTIKEGAISKEEEKDLFEVSTQPKRKTVDMVESISQEKNLTTNYISDVEKLIIREPMTLVKLKQNPIENFWIIEDAYRREFQALGVAFRGFKDENPDGKGNKVAWIKAKERELLAAKREIFEKIRAQVSKQ